MGGGKGGGSTTVQKADPWSGAQPFLLGSQTTRLKQGVQPIYKQEQSWDSNIGENGGWVTKNVMSNPSSDYETVGSPGIFPEAQRLYQQQGWSQGMQDLTDAQSQNIANRAGQTQQAYDLGNAALGGAFDPNVQRVGAIEGTSEIVPERVAAQTVDPLKAFGSLGAADPTGSIKQMLGGQVNTSALNPVVDTALRRMGESFSESVLPNLRGGAIASGQYGSSRQGIAEGLAAKGLGYAMGDTSANMYNNAFNQAQQQMYGTANNMAGLGVSNAQSNANRDLTAQSTNASNSLQAGVANAANKLASQQFNANLGLQNNSQAMQLAQQQLANRAQGLNILGTGNALQDQNYQQQMGLLGAPNDYNWNNLNRYASIITPGAGLGSTSSSSSKENPGALQTIGTLGNLAMTGMMLFSDERLKTDIRKVGETQGGLGIYTFRYKAGGPVQMGVIAQEVEKVIPEAVSEVDGFKVVDYSKVR